MLYIVIIFYFATVDYDIAIPEDGIIAIPHSNSEDDLTIPLQRALPPSGEESMTLAIASPPSPNSNNVKILFHFLYIFMLYSSTFFSYFIFTVEDYTYTSIMIKKDTFFKIFLILIVFYNFHFC